MNSTNSTNPEAPSNMQQVSQSPSNMQQVSQPPSNMQQVSQSPSNPSINPEYPSNIQEIEQQSNIPEVEPQVEQQVSSEVAAEVEPMDVDDNEHKEIRLDIVYSMQYEYFFFDIFKVHDLQN